MNMIEQLTGFAGKPREWFEEATPVQKYGAMGAIAVFLIALVVVILSVGGGEEEWQPAMLYTDLDYTEAAEITTRLSALGIKFQLTEDASAITVPKDQVRDLRLSLASEGYPKSGRMGYEIFDESQLAMTDFLQKINVLTLRKLRGNR